MSCLVKWHANSPCIYIYLYNSGLQYKLEVPPLQSCEKKLETYLGKRHHRLLIKHHKTPSKPSTTVNKEVGHTRYSTRHVQCVRHVMQQKPYYLQLPVVS